MVAEKKYFVEVKLHSMLVQLLIWLQKRLIRAGYNIHRVSLGKWCVMWFEEDSTR